MDLKLDLIIFPMHDWKKCEIEGFRTRDAHFFQHFSKDNRINKILVVNRPTTLAEMIFKRVSWHVCSGSTFKKGMYYRITQTSQKTYVLDIFDTDILKPIILKRDWWAHAFKKRSNINIINIAREFIGMQKPIMFLWSPLSTGVINRLNESLIVFDALDNWLCHPEIRDKRGFIAEGYATIKKNADIIFVNSEGMRELMDNDRIKPFYISNGVDPERFVLKNNYSVPHDIRDIRKPIIGYSGKITKKIDVNLIKFLADSAPDLSFVFIGQFIDKDWVKDLSGFSNIHFLGDKHYNQLPDYLINFDVCIIPYLAEASKMMDPLKLYEYLAAGKPVVTTNVDGVDKFRDIIKITSSQKEFLNGIRSFVARIKEDGGLPDKLRSKIVSEHHWKTKAEFMISAIYQKFIEKTQNG